MSERVIILLLSFLAFVISWLVFHPTLWIAKRYQIVDHPNKRKLQNHPIPVLGGVVTAVGIFVPVLLAIVLFDIHYSAFLLAAMLCMVVIGVVDDICDTAAWLRLMLEVILVWVVLWDTEALIADLHGLFGLQEPLSIFLALPLSIVAGVGIINSINLMDGIDGYSSGYGILANSLFAVIFFHTDRISLALFSLIAVAALLPFFFHNVFGNKTKMFLGDGGSLLIGVIMASDVFALLTPCDQCVDMGERGIGVVALALAILSIPVFDTLRVMCARILRKQSPLWADRTHLHHRYLDLGFSHIGTTICILFSNVLVILLWWCSYQWGWSVDAQFVWVVFWGLVFTCGFYYGTLFCERRQNACYRFMVRMAAHTQIENHRSWLRLQRWIDKL